MKMVLASCLGIMFLFLSNVSIAAPGDLLWQDLDGVHKDTIMDETGTVVAVGKKGVYVAGSTQTTAGGYAFTVRAYDPTSGSLLWADYFDREATGFDEARAVAVDKNGVYVAGSTQTTAGGYAFTVRAYDPTSGSLLWADYFDREATGEDEARVVAVGKKGVYVAGYTWTAAGGYAFTVRAYSTK